jgi:hypothetical protein
VVIRKTLGGELRVGSSVVNKRVICKTAAMKRGLYVCCSYSETVIKPLPGNGCLRHSTLCNLSVCSGDL